MHCSNQLTLVSPNKANGIATWGNWLKRESATDNTRRENKVSYLSCLRFADLQSASIHRGHEFDYQSTAKSVEMYALVV